MSWLYEASALGPEVPISADSDGESILTPLRVSALVIGLTGNPACPLGTTRPRVPTSFGKFA